MCKFCKPDGVCDKTEITRKIDGVGIDIGLMADVLNLNAWIMRDDLGISKLQLCLSESEGFNDLAVLDIPISYCPICGEKL